MTPAKNPHEGQTPDEFLSEEGILEEAEAAAIKRISRDSDRYHLGITHARALVALRKPQTTAPIRVEAPNSTQLIRRS